MKISRCLTLLSVLGMLSCQAVFGQGLASLPTGTYQFTFADAQPGAPLPSGRTLNLVLAPGGAVCVAGYLLSNPSVNVAGSEAAWNAPSIGLRLFLPAVGAGFNNIQLQTASGAFLGTFGNGARTSSATTGCSTGVAGLDFAKVNELFTKAEALHPTLFPTAYASDALRIADGTISRVYADSGITVRVRNGRVVVSGGAFGTAERDVGDVATIITAALGGTPAPRAFPDQQVSWTVAGGLAQVLKPRSANPATRADELAGVTGDSNAHWKEYVIGRTRSQVIADLKPKLKSIIENLWSGNQGILFPESYGIDASVSRIVENLNGLQWLALPLSLKPNEVSNLSFEYMTLKRLLAAGETSLFFPLIHRDAVSLAVPMGGFNLNTSMGALGTRISAYVTAWLTANGATGVPTGGGSTGGSNAMLALVLEIAELSGVGDWGTGLTGAAFKAALDPRLVQLDVALAKLPVTYNAYADAAETSAAALSAFANCHAASADDFCLDESDELLTAQLDFNDAFITALTQAQASTGTGGTGSGSGSSSGSTETGAAFYQRFLTDVATELNRLYEQAFDEIFVGSDYSRSFSPVVISALPYDTARRIDPLNPGPDNCCGFRADEARYYDDPRTAVLYYARGEDVKFGASDPFRFEPRAPLRVRYERVTASSLNNRRGEALTLSKEIVLTSSNQPLFYAIACVSTDQACMTRLESTHGSSALLDSIDAAWPMWAFQFGTFNIRVASVGGLRLWGPVWQTQAQVDQR